MVKPVASDCNIASKEVNQAGQGPKAFPLLARGGPSGPGRPNGLHRAPPGSSGCPPGRHRHTCPSRRQMPQMPRQTIKVIGAHYDMGSETASPREREFLMKRARGTETKKSDTPPHPNTSLSQFSLGAFGNHLLVGVGLPFRDLVPWSPTRGLNMQKAFGRPQKCKRYLC